MKLAIVCTFYRRPGIADQMLLHLSRLDGLDKVDVHAFCDVPNSDAPAEIKHENAHVQKLLKLWERSGLLQMHVRSTPYGLRSNLYGALDEIARSYEAIIVLEDDLIVAPQSLMFFQRALTIIEHRADVFGAAANSFLDQDEETNQLPDAYLLPIGSSWAWATWSHKWRAFRASDDWKNPELNEEFDFGGYPYSRLWRRQQAGDVQSWAIELHAHLYHNKLYFLFPKHTLCENIGVTAEATHSFGTNALLPLRTHPEFQPRIDADIQVNDQLIQIAKRIFERKLALQRKLQAGHPKPDGVKTLLIRILEKLLLYLRGSGGEAVPKGVRLSRGTLNQGSRFLIRPSGDGPFVSIGEDSMIQGRFVVEHDEGSINIGKRSFVGKSMFVSAKAISVGDDVMISWGCTLIDNDAHSLNWEERARDVEQWREGVLQGKTGQFKNWTHVDRAAIVIEDKAWIGFNSIILKGVTIGEGAVVAAGSVVTKSVQPYTLVAGNPAKEIRSLA